MVKLLDVLLPAGIGLGVAVLSRSVLAKQAANQVDQAAQQAGQSNQLIPLAFLEGLFAGRRLPPGLRRVQNMNVPNPATAREGPQGQAAPTPSDGGPTVPTPSGGGSTVSLPDFTGRVSQLRVFRDPTGEIVVPGFNVNAEEGTATPVDPEAVERELGLDAVSGTPSSKNTSNVAGKRNKIVNNSPTPT